MRQMNKHSPIVHTTVNNNHIFNNINYVVDETIWLVCRLKSTAPLDEMRILKKKFKGVEKITYFGLEIGKIQKKFFNVKS